MISYENRTIERRRKGYNMFVYNKEVERVNCDEGVFRKILAYNEDMMMCEIEFKKGAVGSRHAHPHLYHKRVI